MTWPSLKLPRPTVTITGADEKVEAARLRARLAELERTPEDIVRLEAERYAAALGEERRAVVLRLARCEAHDPDEHELLNDPFSAPGGDTRAELSWGQRADEARAHIAAIDAELARVRRD